jgi:hypothetical protein
MSSDTDYYALLSASCPRSTREPSRPCIVRCSRSIIRTFMPATRRMPKGITRRIIEAYEVLGNAASRAEYDRLRQDRAAAPSGDLDEDDASDDAQDLEDEQLDAAWLYIASTIRRRSAIARNSRNCRQGWRSLFK